MKSKSDTNNEGINVSENNNSECGSIAKGAPPVPLWKTWGLRVFFAGMVVVLGSNQFNYILEGASEWGNWRGLGHSMLFALAVFAIGGLFRPLAFLPIMIYEIVWKAVWLFVVALPPWLSGEEIPGIVSVKGSIIGICLIMIVIPWKYVWWRYFAQPIEPWRRKKQKSDNTE
ncbi:hypothetical protein PA25_23110 [Pseudoalteromonas sp. A25]|uniref:hypothetical protein n=1 Tax=Pseudoalteromonas sp. A25 TaxID=116092 RepID=UPI0012609121|nr:hypothetical protein [Pseudoalteromonas sp. A25]BBN82326.1 hypothetical protein PA25_23110 [Pseudoalteromonas sp. A25]